MRMTIADVENILRAQLPDYEERPQQRVLSESVLEAIEAKQTLMAKAPTGVGKSIGYLTSMILNIVEDKERVAQLNSMASPGSTPIKSKRGIVSTASKQLQNQLNDKDAKFLFDHLGLDFTYAVLKGRNNYICQARAMQSGDPKAVNIARLVEDLRDNEGFTGEIDQLGIKVDDKTRMLIQSDSDDCEECNSVECFYKAARNRARAADIAIVNHDLLFTDLWLRANTEKGHVLGSNIELMVLDEAHHVEERGTTALGEDLTIWRIHLAMLLVEKLGKALDTAQGAKVTAASRNVRPLAEAYFNGLREGKQTKANMEAMLPLVKELLNVFMVVRNVEQAHLIPEVKKILNKTRDRVAKVGNLCKRFCEEPWLGDDGFVRVVETRGARNSKVLQLKPISVAPFMRPIYGRVQVSLVSATLPFGYIGTRLGVPKETKCVEVDSPFNFAAQGILYVPNDLPEPSQDDQRELDRVEALADRIKRLVIASKGRALVLFTSRKMMDAVHGRIAKDIPYTVLKQVPGSNNNELAEQFRNDISSVLFGLKTFMTGMDFPRETCSMVIIDKLPFPFFKDPLIEARCASINARRGGNSYDQLMVPEMALTLEQAMGRLIRRTTDKGVVAILDPRLRRKNYGQRVLKSLPRFQAVETFSIIEDFFA